MLALTIGVEENIQEVVGHITEGVCRPLKVRCIAFLRTLKIILKKCSVGFFQVPCPISTMYFHFPRLC